MPAVKFIERLDLGKNRSFPDENYLANVRFETKIFVRYRGM